MISDWFTNGEVSETYRDGSQLFFTGEGQVEIIPINSVYNIAIWTGTFTVTRGTGRFANVTSGSNEVFAVNFPFKLTDEEWYFSYRLQGRLNFGG